MTMQNPIVDDIRYIRTKNNVLWLRLLEIAIESAPDETKKVLREINSNDRTICELLEKLAE